MYSLFACGVPHNRKGFEYTILDGVKLSDKIGQYIDIYDADKMKEEYQYVIQRLRIGKKDYTLLAEYARINPSDQKTSRGSYIAVGVLTEEILNRNTSEDYISRISSLQDVLKTLRNDRNAFNIDFDMKRNLKRIKHRKNKSTSLGKLACDVSKNKKYKKIIVSKSMSENINKNKSNGLAKNKISFMDHLKRIFGMR